MEMTGSHAKKYYWLKIFWVLLILVMHKKLPMWFMSDHKILQDEKCLQIILKG